MDLSHDPPPPANSPPDPPRPRPHLDWTNPLAVTTWLTAMATALATALADVHAVLDDMLRPPRERELGHVKHREISGDAMQTLDDLLTFATPPDQR